MNKKTLRNTIILSLVAVVLVVTTVFTTLAYLRESAIVTNTFSVGNVAISMFETKVDEKGQALETGTKTAENNHYTLQHGLTYKKDPTIYVADKSEDLYLFAVVENTIRNIEAGNTTAALGDESDPIYQTLTMKEQMEKKGWKHYKTLDVNTNVYVYAGAVGTEISAATGTDADFSTVITKNVGAVGIDVFDNFTIGKNVDLSTHGAARVIIRAYAIQASGFGDYESKTATAAAWSAAVESFDGLTSEGVDPGTSVVNQ